MVPRHNYWVIPVTFIIALILAVMPLPDSVRLFRPAWVVMVLIYWNLALPERVNIGSAFILGVLLDVLQGTLLGQHGMSLSLVTYITIKFHKQVRIHPLYQQALFVGFLLVIHLVLIEWINNLRGYTHESWDFLLRVLSSMLLWPWLFIILRDIRRKAHVT